MARDLEAAAKAIEAFLEALDLPVMDDPELKGTGMRVAKAFAEELLEGYAMDPAEILASETSADTRDPVILGPIEATLICPHHLLPAQGKITLGYLPGERVAGLGALAKLAHARSRRLVLQEALGEQLASDLIEHLGARAAACYIDLEHACVVSRSSRAHGARAHTFTYRGERDDDLREAFFAAIGKREP